MSLVRTKPEDRQSHLSIFDGHAMLISSICTNDNVLSHRFLLLHINTSGWEDFIDANCCIFAQTVFAACPANTKVITVIDQDTNWECYCP